jgi:hypothetical protein
VRLAFCVGRIPARQRLGKAPGIRDVQRSKFAQELEPGITLNPLLPIILLGRYCADLDRLLGGF